MKPALRWIPTEVWVDVFSYPWIRRKNLGQIVDKIGNQYIAEILQYCLHERGKRKLKKTLRLHEMTLLGIPQTPVPENIKFFKQIAICHFDTRTLAFLRHSNTLFNDVNLHLLFSDDEPKELKKLRMMLRHLAPLLHGFHSLTFFQCAIPLVEQYFAPKLAKVKMITVFREPFAATLQMGINFFVNWLTLEEQDPTEPSFLKVCDYCAEDFLQISMAIQQQFLSAKRPVTFAIDGFFTHGNNALIANFHLENSLDEQLDGQFNEAGHFEIFRHNKGITRTQLQEWVKETDEKSGRSSGIMLYSFATIGQINANVGANAVNDAGGEEDQPSASNRQKIDTIKRSA